MEEIIEIKFGDSDTETWKPEGMDKLFNCWEKSRSTSTGRIAMNNGVFFSVCHLG